MRKDQERQIQEVGFGLLSAGFLRSGVFGVSILLLVLAFSGWKLYYQPRGDYNLLTHLGEAEVYLQQGSERRPFNRWIRQQWFPARPSPRWNRVGKTVASLGGVSREVLWAHPVDGAPLVIEYPNVSWSDELVLQYGLTDWAARLRHGAEVVMRVELEDGPSFTIEQPNEGGWNESTFSTRALGGRSGFLRLTITTDRATRRHFCINGFTRQQRPEWIAASLARLRRPGSGLEKFGRLATPLFIFGLLLLPVYVFFARRRELGITPAKSWFLAALWVIVLLAYGQISGDRRLRHSIAPHHLYQAEAFLQRQLSLPVERPNNTEWVEYHGKQYVAFPPTPAVWAIPAVALTGLATSDVVFGLVVAACNVVLFFVLLEALAVARLCQLDDRDRLWLLALFAFGTVHLACSKLGGVWFISQLTAVTMATLFVISIVARWHPALSGMFLVLGTFARPPVFFFFPLLAIRLLQWQENGKSLPENSIRLKRTLMQFAIPIVIGCGLMALMNLARFGDPLQFGYDFLGNELAEQYGFFSLHHLPENLRVALLRPPEFSSVFPFVHFNVWGMSMFLTTPAWFGLFRLRRDMPYKWLCLLATVMVALPTLVWASAGGRQFGYRYSLDYTVLLLLLLALGKTQLGRLMKGLIGLSIAINIAGAIWFDPY